MAEAVTGTPPATPPAPAPAPTPEPPAGDPPAQPPQPAKGTPEPAPAKGAGDDGKGTGTALAEPEPPKGQQPPKPPETYDLKLPDGSQLRPTVLEKTAAYAKQRGLSNADAQELVNQQNQAVVDHVEALQGQRDTWLEETKNDAEVGGDKFNENVEIAKRVVDRFGTEGFKKALVDTGLGNQVDVVKTFVAIGKAAKDDSFFQGAPAGPPQKTAAQKMYPNHKPEG